MLRSWMLVISLGLLTACAGKKIIEDDLSYLFLEDVRGESALNWVNQENKRTLEKFSAEPQFKALESEALKIMEAKDKLPYGSIRQGYMYNFWQDDKNVMGVWRRTSLASYKSGKPKWERLLSFDELKAREGVHWVYKGVHCQREPAERCLVRLSREGKDAVELREFDLGTKKFLDDGFKAPEAKMSVAYEDNDTILIATDFGEGTLSKSGYALVVKRWKRGHKLSEAEEVFRAEPGDMATYVFRQDRKEGSQVFIHHALSFQKSKTYLLKDGMHLLPLPEKYDFYGSFNGRFLFSNKEKWRSFPPGSVLELRLDNLKAPAELVFAPGERESVQTVFAGTENFVLVEVTKDVKTRYLALEAKGNKWIQSPVRLPEDVEPSVMAGSYLGDDVFFSVTGFLTPTQILFGNLKEGKFSKVYSLPERFKAKGLTVEQHFATSKDGTKVPYFIVYNKELLTKNGTLPTLLYGYGGFEIPLGPSYLSTTGKLWVERGGAYAVANIRGGGEYGPQWHQAALKLNRHKAYEDFYAVAGDLTAKNFTTPKRLAIEGGSNGGLLTGVAFTQRPELFGAVISSVPLLDMLRYHKLLAGSSWMDEYGDPDTPRERAYLHSYSPFHNVKPDKAYPPLLIVTSTQDDRVHPGHARKMAHRVKDQKHDYYYYENTKGGHAASSNLKERAKILALKFSFLLENL